MATSLETLVQDLPAQVRLQIREAIDRTRIKNPNDPIFELMIVLGIWAKYYESIPAAVKDASAAVSRSLDPRVQHLQTLAQQIQAAIDKLDGAPQAIVDKFPSESLAEAIATKIDARFKTLPLTQLENDLRSFESSIKALVGKDGGSSLSENLRKGVDNLKESAKKLRETRFIPDRWPRELGCILLGMASAALFTSMVMWFSAVRPARESEAAMRQEVSDHTGEMRREMERLQTAVMQEAFIRKWVTVGWNEDNEPMMVIWGSSIKRFYREPKTGMVTMVFAE